MLRVIRELERDATVPIQYESNSIAQSVICIKLHFIVSYSIFLLNKPKLHRKTRKEIKKIKENGIRFLAL